MYIHSEVFYIRIIEAIMPLTWKEMNMRVLYARVEEVAQDCWAVVAALGGGKVLYHEGPVALKVDYFTEAQARRLVARIEAAGNEINEAHWYGNDGDFDWDQWGYGLYCWEEEEKLSGRW